MGARRRAVAARWTDAEPAERFRRSFVPRQSAQRLQLPFVSPSRAAGHDACRRPRSATRTSRTWSSPSIASPPASPPPNADTHVNGKRGAACAPRWRCPARCCRSTTRAISMSTAAYPQPAGARVMRRPGPRPHHRGRYRLRRRARRGRLRRGGVVGVGVFRRRWMSARRRRSPRSCAPAALRAGRERRACAGGSGRGGPADRATDGQVRPPRLDELRCRHRGRLCGDHEGARQATHPADRRPDFPELMPHLCRLLALGSSLGTVSSRGSRRTTRAQTEGSTLRV